MPLDMMSTMRIAANRLRVYPEAARAQTALKGADIVIKRSESGVGNGVAIHRVFCEVAGVPLRAFFEWAERPILRLEVGDYVAGDIAARHAFDPLVDALGLSHDSETRGMLALWLAWSFDVQTEPDNLDICGGTFCES
jgi:hypothetical protein